MNRADLKAPARPAPTDNSRLPSAPSHQLLTGQPPLVTGDNSGIGKAVALWLARAGADVVINYVTQSGDRRGRGARDRGHGSARYRSLGGWQQRMEVERMFEAALAHSGTLLVLVSNAGLQRDSAFTEMTLE